MNKLLLSLIAVSFMTSAYGQEIYFDQKKEKNAWYADINDFPIVKIALVQNLIHPGKVFFQDEDGQTLYEGKLNKWTYIYKGEELSKYGNEVKWGSGAKVFWKLYMKKYGFEKLDESSKGGIVTNQWNGNVQKGNEVIYLTFAKF